MFSVLCSRSLLVIYLIYSSVYMLIPSSWSIPSAHPYFPFGNHKLVFNICKSVSVSWLSSFLSFKKIGFYTEVMSYDLCLWLTSLSMIISSPIYIAASGMVSFFFMAEQCPIAYILGIYTQEWDCWIIW